MNILKIFRSLFIGVRHKLLILMIMNGIFIALVIGIIWQSFSDVTNKSSDRIKMHNLSQERLLQATMGLSIVFSDIDLFVRMPPDNEGELVDLQDRITHRLNTVRGLFETLRSPTAVLIDDLTRVFQALRVEVDRLHSTHAAIRRHDRAAHDRLDAVEHLITTWLIRDTLDGRDTDFIDQLLLLSTGYRDSLSRIAKLASTTDPVDSGPPPPAGAGAGTRRTLALIDDLELRLGTFTASVPEIADHARALAAIVVGYRSAVQHRTATVASIATLTGDLRRIRDAATADIERLKSVMRVSADHLPHEIGDVVRVAAVWVTGLGAVILGLTLLAGVIFISTYVPYPLRNILGTITKIRGDQLDAPPLPGHSDEWAEIEAAINEMRLELLDYQRRLEESEAEYRLLVEAQDHLVVKASIDGKLLFVNKSYCNLFGYTKEDLVGRPFLPLVHEEDREATQTAMLDLYRPPYACYVEQRAMTRHGWRRLAWFDTAVRDDTGRTVAIIGVGRDITEQHQANDQLAAYRRNLEQVIESITDGFITIDCSGTITFLNHHAQALFEIASTPDPAPPPRITHLGIAAEALTRALEAVAHSGGTATIEGVQPDQARWLRLTINRYGGGFSVIIQDVTAEQSARQQLTDAKEKADAANIAKSQFLASMSHELRTPLNAILGFVDLLRATEQGAERKDYLAIVADAGRNLLALIQDVLELSKIEAGKVQVAHDTFDPRRNLEGVIRMFSAKAKEQGLDLVLEVAPTLPRTLKGDPALVRQILINLIGNAFKFTETGSIIVSAELRETFPEAARVVVAFCVADTGIGISADNQERIFRRFEQEDNSMTRRFRGTGLGLAIVKDIVELLGGEIWVRSALGAGARFFFTVPLETVDAPGISEATRDDDGPVVAANQPGARILVAHNDAHSQAPLHAILAQAGFRLECASDGDETVDLLTRNRFDLVILDLEMPKLDGIRIADRIRAGHLANVSPTLPIVAVTAHALVSDRVPACNHGLSEYIKKPVDAAELIRAINRSLRAAG